MTKSSLLMSLLYFNFFRESNIDVYLLEKESSFTTTVRNFKDIGPDFNFNLKVSSCDGETDESFRLFTTTICWFALKMKFMVVLMWVYLFLQVSTGTVPVSLVYLTVSLPNSTKAGNPLIYMTSIKTSPVRIHNLTFLHTIHHKHKWTHCLCMWKWFDMISPTTGWKNPLYRQSTDRPI